MSRDGELMVIHDGTVDRTTDGEGRVGDLTLSELKALDAGSWYGEAFRGERLPTLDEVFALVSGQETASRPAWCFVELKHGSDVYPGIEEKLVLAIARSGLAERLRVISFDHRAIATLAVLAPTLRTGVLYDARPLDSASLAQAAGAGWIGPSVKWVDAAEVARARAAGLEIFVWTANREEAMRRVLELGVTAVGSDYPDRLLAMRDKTRFSATNSF
jgi:glycerophosphoryl diester phosphodiesterase